MHSVTTATFPLKGPNHSFERTNPRALRFACALRLAAQLGRSVLSNKRGNIMSESKIEIKIGEISFSGEGDQEWLSKQLDKIIEHAGKLIKLAPGPDPGTGDAGHKPMSKDTEIAKKTLPAFLQEKNATTKQVKKFLATAVWLEAKGQSRLSTGDVTKALNDANQKRLGNPADCLNQNVGRGYCEKDGKQFYVTDEGKNSL